MNGDDWSIYGVQIAQR